MRCPVHLRVALLALLAGAAPALAQVPVPDQLPDRTLVQRLQAAPYEVLAHEVQGTDPSHRAIALGVMRDRFPDSARVFVLAHWSTISPSEREMGIPLIIGPDGRGLTALADLLPQLGDDELEQLRIGIYFHGASTGADSLAHLLFRHPRASLRVLALRLIGDPVMRRFPLVSGRDLLQQGIGDAAMRVRIAGYEGILAAVMEDSTTRAWGLPLLESGLHDREPEVRGRILRGIGSTRIPVPGALSEIREAARAGSPTRREAVFALTAYGAEAQEAIPEIVARLDHAGLGEAPSLISALERIAPPAGANRTAARDGIRRYLAREDNPYARGDGIQALAALRDTLGLESLVRDEDTLVASMGMRALAVVAPADSALRRAFDDPRVGLRGAQIELMVPLLIADSAGITPSTPTGRAARDSALRVARAFHASGLIGRCFALTHGPFEPHLPIGEDTIYSTPPGVIAFEAAPSPWSGQGRFAARVSPANGAERFVPWFGSWSWDQTTRSLEAAWSTGFSGVVLHATPTDSGLSGELHPFWDFPRDAQKAEVLLRPVACTAIADPTMTGDHPR